MKMKAHTNLLAALAFAGTLAFAGQAQAATVSWTAGADGAWETPANWTSDDAIPDNRVPTSGDTASAGSGGHVITYSSATGTRTIGQLTFRSQSASVDPVVVNQTGGTLNVTAGGTGNGVFYIQNDGGIKSAANYSISGGNLNLARSMNMNTLNSNGDGSWFRQTGGIVSVSDRIEMNARANDMTALYEITNGSLSVTNNIIMNNRSGTTGLSATFDQTGGDVTVGGALQLGIAGTGTAVYNLGGGSLTIETAADPITFGGAGVGGFFDFGNNGELLNLEGTWDFTALTGLTNADFRVDGIAATASDLAFDTTTLSGFTQISVVPEPSAALLVGGLGLLALLRRRR